MLIVYISLAVFALTYGTFFVIEKIQEKRAIAKRKQELRAFARRCV